MVKIEIGHRISLHGGYRIGILMCIHKIWDEIK